MTAAQAGHTRIVQDLVKAGALLDLKCNNGCTALYYAVLHGSLPVVEALIGARCDLNTSSNDGQTPLSIAIARPHDDIVAALREAARINDIQETLVGLNIDENFFDDHFFGNGFFDDAPLFDVNFLGDGFLFDDDFFGDPHLTWDSLPKRIISK
jgi:ankyrin repeat protein